MTPFGFSVADKGIATFAIGYLRMRLAGQLGDADLVRASLAYHAVFLSFAGFRDAAAEYMMSANLKSKDRPSHLSTFALAITMGGQSILSLSQNLRESLQHGQEALAIAKQLQMNDKILEQMFFNSLASMLYGDFRA